MSLEIASNFLNEHPTCVIATVGEDGQPEAATIGFSHDQNWTILIGTNKKSRKYANLMNSPKVALVIGFEGTTTIQIEGSANEVKVDDISERLDFHYNKLPTAKRFQNEDGQTYFLITPNWLRLTDYSAEQPIYETKDFS